MQGLPAGDARDERETMLAGIHCFNRGEYFEAHDVWETLWLRREPGGRTFVQALIQLAAAYHNLRRGKPSGAARLFARALELLDGFPEGWAGIERGGLEDAAARHRNAILEGRTVDPAEFPRLSVPDEQNVSPGDREAPG